jgi:uncharacterized protein YneF (UPF0154 family)
MIVALAVCALICGASLGALVTVKNIDRVLADRTPEERKAIERRVRARRVLRGDG